MQSRGLTWSEAKVSMVSLPGKDRKRINLLAYISCPVYPLLWPGKERKEKQVHAACDLSPHKA